ncbi:PAS domain S-box protein [Nocardia huaxiensis]|uniref:PAS domain S-box protein n=1 Tax=Nocardia huaxiensis TaxID=2755382 RepID=A0A7D6V6V1_9NOCA|nr:PAS domain-containing protein [Nocardia huaxiensis]QLY28094.1 PAS domain S-box protein [Nocardia huaxiensis]
MTVTEDILPLEEPSVVGDAVPLGATELFFSTTDHHGVIRLGNSVFARVSGYALDELVGAPHNLVRHPDMPAGVFELIWERLRANRPVGGFVENRAKDGSAYWVFATMSPLHDGYLSVRIASRSVYFERIAAVYAHARAVEDLAAAAGVGRRERAVCGRVAVEEALRHQGFASYDEFMATALPAEISVRADSVREAFARSDSQGPVGQTLSAALALDAEFAPLVGRLADYQLLCERLTVAAQRVIEIACRLGISVEAAREASRPVADTAPVLANVARVMGDPMRDAVTALRSLPTALDRLRTDVLRLRFRISLAVLHNTTVAAFAAEVIDGTAPPQSLQAVPLLCDAAALGLAEMAEQVHRLNGELAAVAAVTEQAAAALDRFRRFLGQWRILVLRYKAGPLIADQLALIDAEIVASADWMSLLHELGAEFRSATVVIDTDRLRHQWTVIKHTAR